jgi:ankyrin repeat protein
MRSSAMTMANASGCTPLLCAAANPCPHAAAACLSSKLCVETARDLAGRTSVYISCSFGAVRTAGVLATKLPALVTVRSALGHTPLHVVMSRDCMELFEVRAH